eukprot:1157896-Pelagomonas_calceolata.AAC.10
MAHHHAGSALARGLADMPPSFHAWVLQPQAHHHFAGLAHCDAELRVEAPSGAAQGLSTCGQAESRAVAPIL